MTTAIVITDPVIQPTTDTVQMDAIVQAEASIQSATALIERYRTELPAGPARDRLLRCANDALCAAVRTKALLVATRDQYFADRYPEANAHGFFARR